jgi:uncharacterized protein YbjQ (UPF0145 family)
LNLATTRDSFNDQFGPPTAVVARSYHCPVSFLPPSDAAPSLLMVTTESIAGWTIVRTLSYVEGRHKVHGYAINELLKRAHSLGANAIVAVRWSEGPEEGSMGRAASHLVYGTAVVARQEADEC